MRAGNHHASNLQRDLRCAVWAALLVLSLAPAIAGQRLPGNRSIVVRVRDATGAPLVARALVKISSQVGNVTLSAHTEEGGFVEFRGLTMDEYAIEVSAPGYAVATESVTLPLRYPNLTPQVYIYLARRTDSSDPLISGPPLRLSKTENEIQKALEKLAKRDWKAAEKHLQRAEKSAPGDPGVQYLFGVLYLRQQMVARARERLETTVRLYPRQVPALRLLARLMYQQGERKGAIQLLEQTLALDSRSAADHMLLAEILLQEEEIKKAAFHAQLAVQVSQGRYPEMRLLLCEILLGQGERERAAELLDGYLHDFPAHAGAQTARRVLEGIRKSETVRRDGGSAEPLAGKDIAENLTVYARSSDAGANPKLAMTESAMEMEWARRDVDAAPTAVFHDVPCALTEVLERTRLRVQVLASNLGDVSAQETVSHVNIHKNGQPGLSEARRFDYTVSIITRQDGSLVFQEMRDGVFGMEVLGGFATSALTTLALVFHPYYAEDYEMRCEGQSVWRGQPVWLVYFRQRADKPARIHSLLTQRGSFRIPLKGRAWIAANSYEIVRLETGLIAPIPQANLERENMVIEYIPVRFEKRRQTFWLPASADIYVDYRGKRWHRRHTLQNYTHFAVDTQQKIAAPKIPDE